MMKYDSFLSPSVSKRYFLSKILDNVGVHDNRVKNEINLAMTCWGFVNATFLALTMPKLRRRTVYLVRSFFSAICTFSDVACRCAQFP